MFLTEIKNDLRLKRRKSTVKATVFPMGREQKKEAQLNFLT